MSQRTNLLALTVRMSPFAQGRFPIPEFIETPQAVVWGRPERPMSYGDGGAWFTAPITSGYVQRGGYSGFDVKARRPSARRVAQAYGFQPSAYSSDRSPAVPAGPSITPRPPVVHDPSFGDFGKVTAEQVETGVAAAGQVAAFFASIFGNRKAKRDAANLEQQILLEQMRQHAAAAAAAGSGSTQAASVWPWVLGGTVVVLGAGAGAYFLLRRS